LIQGFLGIFQSVGFVQGKAPFRKHMFVVVKGMEDDPDGLALRSNSIPQQNMGRRDI